MTRKIVTVVLAAMVGLSSAEAAYAVCTQTEAAGSWQAYAINSDGEWVRCRLSINSIGTIANNTCLTSFNTSIAMTNGRVRLSSAIFCTYTGGFNLGALAHTIRHATLSKDKIAVQGVGTYSGGSFNFNMTKL